MLEVLENKEALVELLEGRLRGLERPRGSLQETELGHVSSKNRGSIKNILEDNHEGKSCPKNPQETFQTP